MNESDDDDLSVKEWNFNPLLVKSKNSTRRPHRIISVTQIVDKNSPLEADLRDKFFVVDPMFRCH